MEHGSLNIKICNQMGLSCTADEVLNFINNNFTHFEGISRDTSVSYTVGEFDTAFSDGSLTFVTEVHYLLADKESPAYQSRMVLAYNREADTLSITECDIRRWSDNKNDWYYKSRGSDEKRDKRLEGEKG